VRPTVVLRSDRLELRRLDGGNAAFVESLYANALIALGNVRWCTELPGVATIGYSVVPTFWGQGFGTDLAGLVVEFATGTLGVRELRATTLDGNPDYRLKRIGSTPVLSLSVSPMGLISSP